MRGTMGVVDWRGVDLSMAPAGYRALRLSQARVVLSGTTYFVLSGRDHREWLQGQCTNDVLSLEGRPWLDFCLTKPTGQLLALCRAWVRGGTLVVATDRPEVLIERVEGTVILEDVSLRRIEEAFACIQGPSAVATPGSLPSDRTGSGGFELPLSQAAGAEHLSQEGFELATLEAGVPLTGRDANEKTLPPELSPSFDSTHVSYTKGCYTGQEVLMRIRSRGHTNRTWVGLRGDAEIKPGAKVTLGGKEVGTVHRAALSPAFGQVASATLRNEATAAGTRVVAAGVECEVVEMPFLR